MKKLMAILTALMVVLPLGAKADTWATYTPGQEVNFYAYDKDPEGHTSIILSDEGGESQYVKAWFVGILPTMKTDVYADTNLGEAAEPFEKTGAYKYVLSQLNATVEGFEGHAKDITVAGNLQLITLDELKTVFGATQDGEKYVIDVATWGDTFTRMIGSSKGIFTQTVEGDNLWVINVAKDNNDVVTAITVEKVPYATANDYTAVPVVYVDKTYDCTEKQVQNTYACYQCGEDYTWTKIGEQADTCKLVDSITVKSKCVKGPKTGVEEYILEFIAVAGVCGVALVIAKRKDLFRSI